MSGFGAMDFMNKALANNRAILKRQSLFEVRKELKIYNKSERKYTYKSATKADLKKIKDKMVLERKKNIAKAIFSFTLSIALIIVTILLLRQYLIE